VKSEVGVWQFLTRKRIERQFSFFESNVERRVSRKMNIDVGVGEGVT
tara:strand:- start:920 stop:1060 length:141 start_codon:yes stop_codon:yes gene_type:complete